MSLVSILNTGRETGNEMAVIEHNCSNMESLNL